MKALSAALVTVCALFFLACATGTPSPSIQCSVQTAGHGNVTGAPPSASCRLNRQCNSLATKPLCAAPEDNTCLCNTRDASGNCTAGQCVWHVDPAITSCVCVPGQTQRCTPTGGTTLSGYQDCSTNGAQWGTCVAPTIAIAPTSAPALQGATAETP
jgi:hypothetical protein